VLGNPVRDAVIEAHGTPLQLERPRVLVLGGSQGARRLNLSMPDALASADARGRGLRITHQSGDAMAEAVRRRYDELDLQATVEPFIDDMAEAYRAATLIVCRAGATTLAELGVVGRPAVLVPFPFAIDDHQRKNAEELERAGAALVVSDDEATAERLGALLGELLDDRQRLREMSERSLSTGVVDATEKVVTDLEELIGVQG